jgi:hypothetical protein
MSSGSLPCMAESSTQSIVVDAPLSRVADVICAFARYPEWTGAVRSAEVLAEYADGYASRVQFELDAGPVRDEYVLAYRYADDLSRIAWELVEPSLMQKAQTGSYDLADNGDGTCTVTYTLEVELSIPMLGMFRRKAERVIMDTALKELKRRLEARGADAEEGGGS